MKKETYRFKIPIIEANVFVSFAHDPHDGGKHLSKYLKRTVDCSGAVACVDSEASKIGVWIGRDAKNKTVVHECHHVIKKAYEWLGAEMGGEEELDACFLEFISGKILDAWEKHRLDHSRPAVVKDDHA